MRNCIVITKYSAGVVITSFTGYKSILTLYIFGKEYPCQHVEQDKTFWSDRQFFARLFLDGQYHFALVLSSCQPCIAFYYISFLPISGYRGTVRVGIGLEFVDTLSTLIVMR